MMKKIAAFDIFGTSFGFDNVIQAIEEEFGDDLRLSGTSPAQMFMGWFYATQRDFTYLSLCGEYTPMPKVFAATLRRSLLIAFAFGPPNTVPTSESALEESSLTRILEAMKDLPPRPGLIQCFELLWKEGFEVYAVSNGAKEGTKRLLSKLESEHRKGVFTSGEFDENIISCDQVKKAKPAPEIYEFAISSANVNPQEDECWFVAAHTWDLLPARKVGFKTAYVDYEEIYPAEELFGRPNVEAKGLAELAKRIIASSKYRD